MPSPQTKRSETYRAAAERFAAKHAATGNASAFQMALYYDLLALQAEDEESPQNDNDYHTNRSNFPANWSDHEPS